MVKQHCCFSGVRSAPLFLPASFTCLHKGEEQGKVFKIALCTIFKSSTPAAHCLIGKLVSFGLLRKKKKKLRQFQKMLPHICLAFFPCYHSADPMCSFQQTSPSDEASKKQLLMPHRPSVDHSDEPFQRQRAVSAVSIITSALEGKMCL